MGEYIFIRTYQGSRGKMANVTVMSLTSFAYNKFYADRGTQIAEIDGGNSIPLREMNIEMFEKIFNPNLIKIMQENGRLDYYPAYICISNMYPIFSAKVYKKYGVPKEK